MVNSRDINKFLNKVILYREQNDTLLSLNFGVYNNTLRLYVRSTDLEKKNKSKLLCNMSLQPEKARFLKELLKDIKELSLENTDKKEIEVKLYGIEWDSNNKPIPNSKKLLGSLAVGKLKNKNNEIVNYLAITNMYGKKFIFPFLPTPYEEYYIDGKKIENKTILSSIKIKSFTAIFSNILNFVPEIFPETEENLNNIKNRKFGNNNNSNYNNNNKSSKQSSEPVESSDSSDDIDDLF